MKLENPKPAAWPPYIVSVILGLSNNLFSSDCIARAILRAGANVQVHDAACECIPVVTDLLDSPSIDASFVKLQLPRCRYGVRQ
jgi:hypothetical protein